MLRVGCSGAAAGMLWDTVGRGEVRWVGWMGVPPPGLRAASRIKPGEEAALDGRGETTRPQTCQQCSAAPSQLGSFSMD